MPKTAKPEPRGGTVHADLSGGADGHNGPAKEDFLFFVGQFKKADKRVADERAARKRLRQRAQNAGVNLDMADRAIAELDRDEGTTLSNLRDLQRYLEFLNLPVAHQMSFFDSPAAGKRRQEEDVLMRAYNEGKSRGVMGIDPDEMAYPPLTKEGMRHAEGWGDGQAINLAKLAENSEAMEAERKAEEKAAADKIAKKKAAAEEKAAKATEPKPEANGKKRHKAKGADAATQAETSPAAEASEEASEAATAH